MCVWFKTIVVVHDVHLAESGEVRLFPAESSSVSERHGWRFDWLKDWRPTEIRQYAGPETAWGGKLSYDNILVTRQRQLINHFVVSRVQWQHAPWPAWLPTQQIYIHCLKRVPTFKLSVTLSNLNRFLYVLHCWKAYKICYNPIRHYAPQDFDKNT